MASMHKNLKILVEVFFESLDEELIRKTVANILKRARICLQQNGGHFEHRM